MGGSGLQWSFSGLPENPPQILSFKPSSSGGNHSIYTPGSVQKVASSIAVNGGRCSAGSAYKSSAVVGSTYPCGEETSNGNGNGNGPSQMTVFYNGLVCVYEDVAPEKAQAIMLLAGNGNSRSQEPAEVIEKKMKKSVLTDLPAGSKSAPANPHNDPVSAAPNPIRLSKPAIPIHLDLASASTSNTVEISTRNQVLRYPSPATGLAKTNRFRFSPSNVTIDPVLAAASISRFDTMNNPGKKFPPPVACNQFHFSQSAHGSTSGNEAGSNNSATKFSPPAGSVGFNQIRFSKSAAAFNAAIEANPKNSISNFIPPATAASESNQIRFPRSSLPIDHGPAGAPISIVESNPIRPAAKFPDPATSSGLNQFRFPQPVERNQLKGIHQFPQKSISVPTAKDPASARASSSTADPSASSGSIQLRFSHSIERNSTKPVSQNTHSGEIVPAAAETKFSDPETACGSSQLRFSQSGRSMSNSSAPDLAKPVSPATPVDRDSGGATISGVETGEVKVTSTNQTPAKGSGKTNQVQFSQSGVPLARKTSLARFLEKRKERPSDVESLGDFPSSKHRSNSQ